MEKIICRPKTKRQQATLGLALLGLDE